MCHFQSTMYASIEIRAKRRKMWTSYHVSTALYVRIQISNYQHLTNPWVNILIPNNVSAQRYNYYYIDQDVILCMSMLNVLIMMFIAISSSFICPSNNGNLNDNWVWCFNSNYTHESNFCLLEVVGRGSETQLQVSEDLNSVPFRFNHCILKLAFLTQLSASNEETHTSVYQN